MAKIQTGLGRGLGALISDVNSIQQSAGKPAAQPARPLVSTSEIEISRIEFFIDLLVQQLAYLCIQHN